MSRIDYSSRVGAVYFNDGADGSVVLVKKTRAIELESARSIEEKHDSSYMVDASRQSSQRRNDDKDDDGSVPLMATSYFRQPYLSLMVFGRRLLSLTRQQYDTLSPFMRRLADSTMIAEKEH